MPPAAPPHFQEFSRTRKALFLPTTTRNVTTPTDTVMPTPATSESTKQLMNVQTCKRSSTVNEYCQPLPLALPNHAYPARKCQRTTLCSNCKHLTTMTDTVKGIRSTEDPDIHNVEAKEWSHESFSGFRYLTKGQYGKVYKAQHRKDGKMYALKFISKPTVKSMSWSSLLIEKKIGQTASEKMTPFVLHTVAAYTSPANFVFVMEYLDYGSIRKCMKARQMKTLPSKIVRSLAVQMVSGLSFIHSMGYIHRDVKPDNILVGFDGNAKVADFGLSIEVSEPPAIAFFGGTAPYASPEAVLQNMPRKESDFYGLGMIMFEMLKGYLPYVVLDDINSQFFREVYEKNCNIDDQLWLKIEFDSVEIDFLQALLNKNYAMRTEEMIMKKKYFVDVDWEKAHELKPFAYKLPMESMEECYAADTEELNAFAFP